MLVALGGGVGSGLLALLLLVAGYLPLVYFGLCCSLCLLLVCCLCGFNGWFYVGAVAACVVGLLCWIVCDLHVDLFTISVGCCLWL